ncbi:spore germination protein [Thalassobacillus devorans]|uniref:Spore germination protein n=1 Tax=Thalassobacillus devorans TaxID=279813 RepID=A0ABQ1NJH6_9BACI|nr:spore germination protein [Thalassobacillus devorans]NIK27549.1 spore germination protein KA [Thalassobacillus devorans]GGC78621.1 spore germination protein [Thalassobacillus devorans]
MVKRRRKQVSSKKESTPATRTERNNDALSDDLDKNADHIRSVYAEASDLIFRRFYIAGKQKAVLFYLDGLVDIQELDDSVLSPLMEEFTAEYSDVKELLEKKISVSGVKEFTNIQDCLKKISSGFPVILLEGRKSGIALNLTKFEKRAIDEPPAEAVIRGPREGFVETLGINRTMLRRKIKSPKLKMKEMEIGKYSVTPVILAYMDGIAEEGLIKEAENRLKRIDIDGVLDSGIIEELVEDNPYSPFPQILTTERPDVATSHLLEGRFVVLVDGSPFVLIAPVTIYSFLQASEDYYNRFIISTLIRWLRYIFLLISLLLPSIYVAVITFHAEMVPTSLMIGMAASREAIPFPALIEALLMEITFEALREAGLRLPKQVGSAVSIVGALVIGEAAVMAGIVSAPMVIVVALTGIASFTIPRYSGAAAIRMLRFPMILLAGTLGLLGIMLGLITIIIHLATIRSFGVPYLSPMAPMMGSETKDVLVRAPWWKLNTRPHLTGKYNKYRQAPGQKPGPKHGGD